MEKNGRKNIAKTLQKYINILESDAVGEGTEVSCNILQ